MKKSEERETPRRDDGQCLLKQILDRTKIVSMDILRGRDKEHELVVDCRLDGHFFLFGDTAKSLGSVFACQENMLLCDAHRLRLLSPYGSVWP